MRMLRSRRLPVAGFAGLAGLMVLAGVVASAAEFRRLPVREYRDKMKAGWLGQMVGVSWGGPTEFKWKDAMIPADQVPQWKPALINEAFPQDDLYVEMTFLRTLEQYGLDVSIRQAGIDFANSGYPLWCANNAGRNNLRRGIAPPDSSHPQFNKCPNDIDYQIEADFSGLIAPGLPQFAIECGEKFGRLMNYGDGMYAGQFIGALYAAAFFETDPVKLIETALAAIPHECQYAEMVRDLLAWYRAQPDDWEMTWRQCQRKYRENPEYQQASNGGIDCKINGAYVLLGLLHGRRDFDRTIILAMRAGQDSDCNPSSAAGVLFTTYGAENIPRRFTRALDELETFSHTEYTFPKLLTVSEQLARQVIVRSGGKIIRENGEEVFLIPTLAPQPSRLARSWSPGPIAGSRFTPAEMAQITARNVPRAVTLAAGDVLPGWEVDHCGTDMDPGLRAEYAGRRNVVLTHPLDRETGCTLTRKVNLPAGKTSMLRITVARDLRGDFDLVVRVNGQELLRKPVNPQTTTADPWLVQDIDLSSFAGHDGVKLELVNQPSGWSYEAAYWAGLQVLHH
ncbi:MAG TPA: ADP-ribosylglycohydrolase family protein [Verrucomicrobiota bacterium]|nr:ADP-ribosylglycohydrolase family protein [Verrucomicrobiota bacterium]HNT15211.1 ADP-ribosylglycohydrolase family protein [Verrucomicrobiota bacterium]